METKTVVTLDQLKKLFKYLMSDRQGSFRYIIYDIMGFDQSNYCELYYTGLMSFKDWIYDLKTNGKYEKIEYIANALVEESTKGEALFPDMTPKTQEIYLIKAKKIFEHIENMEKS